MFIHLSANVSNLYMMSKHHSFRISQELESFLNIFLYIAKKSICIQNFKCELISQEFRARFVLNF